MLQLDGIRLEFAQLVFTPPQFTWQSFIGVALLGIGSAFWGLVAGALAIAIGQLLRQLFKVP